MESGGDLTIAAGSFFYSIVLIKFGAFVLIACGWPTRRPFDYERDFPFGTLISHPVR